MPPPPPGGVLGEGPYVWSEVHGTVMSSRPAHGAMRPVKLPLCVTVPMSGSPGSNARPGPFPVCVLLNGFQARASYYSALARRLASWGLVVLQYNAPALTIIPDAVELPFLSEAVGWLQHAAGSDAAQPALQGRADLGRLVVAGHSRGGKLAALHYSSGAVGGHPIRAAFLIDPVDNTRATPESQSYPSATKALRAAGRPFGMAAAGLISASNPEGSNWKLFESVAPPGSWRLMLKRAGHTSFMKPPTGVETWLLDRVFGGGPASREVVVAQTAAAMVAWFQQQLATTMPSAAAAGGGLAAVTARAPVPLAASAMHAAAVCVAGAPQALPGSGSSGGQGEDGSGDTTAAFVRWATSPLVADEVDFAVAVGSSSKTAVG